eukprot:scaffold103035_cov72-Phaeocystis_antarctica.AAC.1
MAATAAAASALRLVAEALAGARSFGAARAGYAWTVGEGTTGGKLSEQRRQRVEKRRELMFWAAKCARKVQGYKRNPRLEIFPVFRSCKRRQRGAPPPSPGAPHIAVMDASENPLSDATVLVQIAEAARKDPATLQPALVALQSEAPHLLLRVQANQAAFLALIQGEQRTPPSATADAVPHSATVPQPAPEAQHAAPAPVVTEAPVSSEEAPPGLAVTIVHKGTPHALQIDLEESVEVLRFQVFSLTDVPPNEQHISGLGPGVLRDGADLRTLGIVPGTWAMLARTPAAAPVASAPAPTTDAAAAVAAAAAAAAAGSAQGRARMEGRLISGLETARGHADPLKQAAARAVVPWARLCATAAAARADSVGDAA